MMSHPLRHEALAFPKPQSYFSGRSYSDVCMVNNIIFFVRTARRGLQEATFESRPHHRFVVIFNLETAGAIRIGERLNHLEPGQGLMIFPFQFHTFPETAEERILWLILTFETSQPELLEDFRGKIFSFGGDVLDEMASLLRLYKSGKGEAANQLLGLGVARLLARLRALVRTSVAPQPKAEDGRSRQLLNDIEARLRSTSGGLPIRELADSLHISESRLRVRFRSAFSLSLGSYLRNYRLHRIIELMRDSRRNLTEIAHELGFGDSAALTRFFRTQTGVIPSKFRLRVIRSGLRKPLLRPQAAK
jgi:AraC-like DNA-binding protein